jgi:penicillin-binding protein 2
MVSKPDFDPNLFTRPLSPEEWSALNDDEHHPMLNRAIKASYPPGSTFKTITAIAGLETHAITVGSHFQSCPGGMQFGNRFFRCWASGGHGSLNLREAIAQSCDVYFYQLGRKVGLEPWSHYARMFGFGARTGIDLEGEEKGLVPDTEYYNKRFGRKRWSQNLIVNLSVGQGEILATPLQLAVLAGVIGTEGHWHEPHVVKGIELPETGTIFKKRVVSRELSDVTRRSLAEVKEGMTEVVMGNRGTGRGAAIEGVTVAGKTGTAQNPHGEDHALFICFAPAEDPAIAIAVVVENGGKGSAVAAPVARRIMRAYLYDDYEEEASDGQAVAATE